MAGRIAAGAPFMIKKILLTLILLAMAVIFAISLFSRRAPELLRSAIERALNKKVVIGSIEYHFPSVFDIQGFTVKENAPFTGEDSFSVDHIRFKISPLSWSRKRLIIDRIDVENADIVIRKINGRVYHVLTDAIKRSDEPLTPQPALSEGASPVLKSMPLEIHQFNVKNSNFQFMDFDAQQGGFVIVLDQIRAKIHNIMIPFEHEKTTYEVDMRLLQGRDLRPADMSLRGWSVFKTKDTDANFVLTGAWLPYFRPYYGQVTFAAINNGQLDGRANLHIERNDLVLNANLEIIGLLFQSYENENQLFGLKADEILSFLKDSSGHLKLQFTARWNLADRSVRARDVIRKSIERSLKSTVLGNVGNILQNVIQKVGDVGVGQTKDSLENKLKKLKDLIKF